MKIAVTPSSDLLPHAGPSAARREPSRAWVAAWLLGCCALIFAMVVVGGVTRLTHSGLSIVEWQPIVGAVPPLTDTQWADTFAKYQQTPEYRLVNQGMSLDAFKGIFWWEYAHRLLGRLIGAAFILPLVWFWIRRSVDRSMALQLGAVFVLGALQGAMGWYMVQSGLVDDPRVSQYRLTAHLSIAVAIYAVLLWTALNVLRPAAKVGKPSDGLSGMAWLVAALTAGQFVTGGLVAGIRAGLAYNSFPLMNGHWIPREIMTLDPWYLNFFANMATVQFDHRLGAWALIVAVPWLWLKARRAALPAYARAAAHALLAALLLQITLGIATLLLRVPVPLAAAHQAGALILLSAALVFAHSLRQPRVQARA